MAANRVTQCAYSQFTSKIRIKDLELVPSTTVMDSKTQISTWRAKFPLKF